LRASNWARRLRCAQSSSTTNPRSRSRCFSHSPGATRWSSHQRPQAWRISRRTFSEGMDYGILYEPRIRAPFDRCGRAQSCAKPWLLGVLVSNPLSADLVRLLTHPLIAVLGVRDRQRRGVVWRCRFLHQPLVAVRARAGHRLVVELTPSSSSENVERHMPKASRQLKPPRWR